MTVVLDLVAICICLYAQCPGQHTGTGGRVRTCEEERRPHAGTVASASASGGCCGIGGKVIQSFATGIGKNGHRLSIDLGCYDSDADRAVQWHELDRRREPKVGVG